MDIVFDVETLIRMAMELSFGLSIKLYVENGRISWRDFREDYLFWLPAESSQTNAAADPQKYPVTPMEAVA